jgi:sucrose-6-phosphate hydrolase SacC (GH32 family)
LEITEPNLRPDDKVYSSANRRANFLSISYSNYKTIAAPYESTDCFSYSIFTSSNNNSLSYEAVSDTDDEAFDSSFFHSTTFHNQAHSRSQLALSQLDTNILPTR